MTLPGSDPAYWDRVEAIFVDALAAGDSARTAVLDARCGTLASLRAEVEVLLDAHARAGEFIEPRRLDGACGADDSGTHYAPGTRIGAFRLLERIAHGGMGEVYRAERAEGDFTQQVAIKLIAARLHGADTVRRFRAERQILASLQHPNIVTLVDGGVTPDGQPYIVMEYIDGLPITEYCRRHSMALTARLPLFQQVCAAVSFAHRHLVVHRDLKPGNVIVTTNGVVKVLDFGIAKLLAPQDAPAAATVSVGPLTPNYASPEQLRGLPVTTVGDVYALGVMLYELLSGERPYETADRTLDEIVAIVLDREPPRPSATRGDRLPYDPGRLRGDLDAIVFKAMAKDPRERYGSAEELSEDLGRVLAAKPVIAREPSLLYLTRKTMRRHRAAFSVAAVFLVLLFAALAGAIWQARVAAHERERAVQRFDDVRQLASTLIFRIHDEVEPLAGSTPVRATIIAEGLKFLERLEPDASGNPGLQLELANAYLRIGNVQGRRTAANLGDRAQAIRSFRKAQEIVAPLARSHDPSWEVVKTRVDADLAIANAYLGDDSVTAAREALAAASGWLGREPTSVRAIELLARAHFAIALLVTRSESLAHWQESNRLFSEALAREPQHPTKLRNVALTEKYLGSYFEDARDAEKALEHYQRAYALDERRVKVGSADRLAQLDVAIDLANIAYPYELRGAYREAVDYFRRSLEIRERLSESDPKDVYAQGRVAHAHHRLAALYLLDDQLPLAAEHARRAIALFGSFKTMDAPWDFAATLHTLAQLEGRAGRRGTACAANGKSKAAFDRVPTRSLAEYYRSIKSDVDRAVAACRGE